MNSYHVPRADYCRLWMNPWQDFAALVIRKILEVGTIISPFYKQGNGGLERASNLLTAMQLVGGSRTLPAPFEHARGKGREATWSMLAHSPSRSLNLSTEGGQPLLHICLTGLERTDEIIYGKKP